MQCKACQQHIEQWRFQAWAESVILLVFLFPKLYRGITAKLQQELLEQQLTLHSDNIVKNWALPANETSLYLWFLIRLTMKIRQNIFPTALKLAILKTVLTVHRKQKKTEMTEVWGLSAFVSAPSVFLCVHILQTLSAVFRTKPHLAGFHAVSKISNSSNTLTEHMAFPR